MITRVVSGLYGGRRAGSFAGKAGEVISAHPVGLITRTVSGIWGGKRAGSFAGKAGEVTSAHPVGTITRPVSGLWGGKRYGSFAGKALSVITPETPTQSRFASFDEEWDRELTRIMRRRHDEEIVITVLITAVTRGML